MFKDLEYYINLNKKECVRGKLSKPLLVDNYLSEFNTVSEKLLALNNLGISEKLLILKNLIDNKVIESGNLPWDIEPTVGNSLHILSSDSLFRYFLNYYTKEQFETKFQILWQEIINYITSAKFNVDSELSNISENAVQNRVITQAINKLLPTLLSGINIKTINGETLLGRGNIEIEQDLSNYITREEIEDYATKSEIDSLASKQFVNDSISIAAATFRGTFSSLLELLLLEADNNDYGFVYTTDDLGNTIYNRYKFDGTNWIFEYQVSNSSFTPELWESINSNLTSLDKEKLNNLPTKQQLDSSIELKANKSDTYTKEEINLIILNIKPKINHVFLTLEAYDELDFYEEDTLYFIIEKDEIGMFLGDKLPIRLGWAFGGEFPVVLN